MKTGPSVTGAAWGKVNLTAKAITEGGFESMFKQIFSPSDPNEKLKKTFACYLSTSTGPVAGTIYLSTARIAFCSDRPLCFTAPSGQETWSYYKVLKRIPSWIPIEYGICSSIMFLIFNQTGYYTIGESWSCESGNDEGEIVGEIHTDSYGWWSWFLVHGICELWESFDASYEQLIGIQWKSGSSWWCLTWCGFEILVVRCIRLYVDRRKFVCIIFWFVCI